MLIRCSVSTGSLETGKLKNRTMSLFPICRISMRVKKIHEAILPTRPLHPYLVARPGRMQCIPSSPVCDPGKNLADSEDQTETVCVSVSPSQAVCPEPGSPNPICTHRAKHDPSITYAELALIIPILNMTPD